MLTIFNILALIITINTSQFNFLWSIRSLDAITFIKTDQDFLQIFTSQRLNAVDSCLSNRIGLQSWECDNILLIEAIKECRQFHGVCLLFVTCNILPYTKSIVTTVYQKNLEHSHIRFMRQCLAASHHAISARPPVMVTNTDAVTYIIYATAQIHLVFERTIDVCQPRSYSDKCQYAGTACLFQQLTLYIIFSIFLQCYPCLQPARLRI